MCLNMLAVSDQGCVNCWNPGPCCSNWDTHVWEESEGPSAGAAPLDSCFSVSRDSEGMEAILGSVASLHLELAAAGYVRQQREHVTF
jgi:hypothetical protein